VSDELIVKLGPGKRVEAQLQGGLVVHTDQPVDHGGEGSAPSPFALFLASLGTCAGVFVASFCRSRGLSTEGIRLLQRSRYDESGRLVAVEIDVELPASFPEKYREALPRVVDGCTVKRAIAAGPEIAVRTVAA
jgi:ribosomal protein S12 methylthiotransferase accessory factor